MAIGGHTMTVPAPRIETPADRERNDRRPIILTSRRSTPAEYSRECRNDDIQPWQHFDFDRDDPREHEPPVEIRIAHDTSAATAYRALRDALGLLRNVVDHTGDLHPLEKERFLTVLSQELQHDWMLRSDRHPDVEEHLRQSVDHLFGPPEQAGDDTKQPSESALSRLIDEPF